jgi:hypothetical protein
MFSENDEDTLQSLPFNVCVQTLMQVEEENERKKETKETKVR